MERKVRTGRLKKGMYVSNLDRPWMDTPFLLQGFYIQTLEDLIALDKYCEYVYIDPERGVAADMYWDETMTLPSNKHIERFLHQKEREVDYQDEHDAADEMHDAKEALEQALDKYKTVIDKIHQRKKLDIQLIRSFIRPLIASIIRNPDALLWLSRLRNKDDYPFSHAVDNTVLALAFGRHMGLPEEDMLHLAIGTLLFDIGKLNIKAEILNKRTRLNEDEFAVVKRHVDDGVDYLNTYEQIHPDSLNLVLTHHERHNGSGYPNKLSGGQIPVYGRMAGLIDCYDAMTNDRSYSEAISPHLALQKIYSWRNHYFQDELVEQFLRCLGAYPTGSLLEMKSGQVGIVLSQNRQRHMKPTVMLLLDEHKKAYFDFPIVDLMEQGDDTDEPSLAILRGLNPGAYGINPQDFYV